MKPLAQIELSLQYRQHQNLPVEAILVASQEPSEWVELLCDLGVSLNSLSLLPLPEPGSDRVSGVLVYPIHVMPQSHCPVVPYRRRGDRLWIPCDGSIEPDVTDDELSEIVDAHYIYVWLGTGGLVGFEDINVVRVVNLFEPSKLGGATWHEALPGSFCSDQVQCISRIPDAMINVEKILNDAGGDIGRDAETIDSFQPKDEASGSDAQGVGKSIKKILHSAGAMVRQLTRNMTARIAAKQEERTQKLLKMLDQDPDVGLRYALPLHDPGHRGLAPPSAHLPEREPTFNLRWLLGSSLPASPWYLSGQHQLALQQKYRQLANRELQLGRHRRAAYIFGELLGDLSAAAGALRSGGHYQEAAVIYEKLMQFRFAADCFCDGMYWKNALELYTQLDEYLLMGYVHHKLGQEELARAAYERAIENFISVDKPIAASEIALNQLRDCDRSLQILEDAWPHSKQGFHCIRRAFSQYGQDGLQRRALESIERLATSSAIDEVDIPKLIEEFVVQSQSYPDASVRECARRISMKLISQQIAWNGNEAAAASLPRLFREDRLLLKDCQRFINRNKVPQKMSSISQSSFHCADTIQLPSRSVWLGAVATSRVLVLIGADSNGNQFVRPVEWNGIVYDRLTFGTKSQSLSVSAPLADSEYVKVHVVGIKPVVFSLHVGGVEFSGVRGAMSTTVAFCARQPGIIWAIELGETGASLIAFGLAGEPIESHSIPPSMVSAEENIFIRSHTRHVFIAWGEQFIVFKAGRFTSIPVPSVTGLEVASPAQSPVALIVHLEGALFWHDHMSFPVDLLPLPVHVEWPQCSITRGGFILVAQLEQVVVLGWDSERREFQTIGTYEVGHTVVSVVPGIGGNEFGVLTCGNTVQVVQIRSLGRSVVT